MKLNEQEAHCIARHLQALLYGRGLSDACNFCKVQCFQGDRAPGFEEIKERLTKETGVDLRIFPWETLPELGDFPYKKFLKNSNESIITYYHERWGYTPT